jgi:hypothetical protein
MINILLDRYLGQTNNRLFNELRNYIKPNHKVAVIAFSFRDNRVTNLADWEGLLYGKKESQYYDEIFQVVRMLRITRKATAFYYFTTAGRLQEKKSHQQMFYIF